MWVINDLISEALARANIVGRRQIQNAPGDKVWDALDILRDIAADFTNKNLLQWLQGAVEINPNKPAQYVLQNGYIEDVDFWYVNTDGSDVPDVPSAGVWDRARCWDKDCSVWDIYTEPGQAGTAVWRKTSYPSKDAAIAHLNGAIKVIPEGIQPETILGVVDESLAGTGDYVDVEVEGLDRIIGVYYELYNAGQRDMNQELQFVSYEEFWSANWGSYVYTWQPISDTKVKLWLKQDLINRLQGNEYGIKVIYNKAWHFDLYDEVRAPDVYRSLFLSALTYRLAVRWPRLDPAHTERLRLEMEERIATVSSKTRAMKYVTRDLDPLSNRKLTRRELWSGSFVFGG